MSWFLMFTYLEVLRTGEMLLAEVAAMSGAVHYILRRASFGPFLPLLVI